MTSESLRDFSDQFLWIIDQVKQQQVALSVEGGLTTVAPDEGEGETGVFDGTTVVSQRIRSLYGTDPLPGSTTLQWAGEGTALHFFVAKQLDHATVITCPGSTRPFTMVFVSVEFAKKYFYPLHAKWCQDAAVTLSIKIGSSSFINLRSSDGGKPIKSIPQATACLSLSAAFARMEGFKIEGQFACKVDTLTHVDLTGIRQLGTISDNFLSGNKCLKTIKFPSCGVETRTIGDSFLRGCCSLEEVDLSAVLAKVFMIGHRFLSDCFRLTTVKWPQSAKNPIRFVGHSFFGKCPALSVIENFDPDTQFDFSVSVTSLDNLGEVSLGEDGVEIPIPATSLSELNLQYQCLGSMLLDGAASSAILAKIEGTVLDTKHHALWTEARELNSYLPFPKLPATWVWTGSPDHTWFDFINSGGPAVRQHPTTQTNHLLPHHLVDLQPEGALVFRKVFGKE